MGNKKFINFAILLIMGVIIFQEFLDQTSKKPPAPESKPANEKQIESEKAVWPFLKTQDTNTGGVERLAKNIYLVFDGSGSMASDSCLGSREKIGIAKDAVNEFLGAIDESTYVGLHVFDGRGNNERVPLGVNNRQFLTQEVQNVFPSGGTPLRSAIEQAYRKLTEQARKQFGYGEYHLVVITDGEASGDNDPRPIVNKIIGESPVIIHTIGFCIAEKHSLNQPGRVLYKTANDKASLSAGLRSVLAEAPEFDVKDFK